MDRRFLRKLMYALIAVQIIAAPPVAGAFAKLMPDAHCASSMPAGVDQDSCPCCPEGVTNMVSCLSACTASAGAIPSLEIPAPCTIILRVAVSPFLHRTAPSEPPLDPPPIA
ncbi:MAG TPA: hypothetical protein VF033_11725 [Steroidobacteraceae bacterium]|jgi:hypothetical protein